MPLVRFHSDIGLKLISLGIRPVAQLSASAFIRYLVLELKTGKLQPEYAGKLGFYVALVDDRLRRQTHAPTVGIPICGSGNEHTVR